MTDPSTIAPTVATVAPPTTAVDDGSTTSTVPASTIDSTTTSTVAPTLTLSADGPWTRVDSAPGVDTPGLFYELMPKLWVYLPTAEDLDHGITWVFNETDRPVIEAYLRAQLVYFESGVSGGADSRWGDYYADGDDTDERLAVRVGRGERIDLDLGVVLRPAVLGEEREVASALVFDCALDGSVYTTADGGLADGSSTGVAEVGRGFRMSSESGRWLIVDTGSQPEACL